MTKKIAVYGSYETKEKIRQRYWHVRVDGIRQRYWHTPKNRLKKVAKKGRYEFHGKGKELFKSIIKAHARARA